MKTSTIKFLLIIIFLTGFAACKIEKKQSMYWETVEVDTSISSNPVYVELDKQNDFFSVSETFKPDFDSTVKRTSDVIFARNDVDESNKNIGISNCRAFIKNDTLIIKIGYWDSYGGHGFIIKYTNSKFHTEPFIWIHNDDGIAEPVYKIEYQKLILDKTLYKVGDSLYGKIDFKSGREDNLIGYNGKGFFRTKILKPFVAE